MSSARSSARQAPAWVTAVLLILGVIVAVVAVIYFVEPAHKLPSFFPGHTKHGTRIRLKHGIAAAVVAALLLIGAWISSARKRVA